MKNDKNGQNNQDVRTKSSNDVNSNKAEITKHIQIKESLIA